MCILDDLNKHAITLGNGGLDFEGGFFGIRLQHCRGHRALQSAQQGVANASGRSIGKGPSPRVKLNVKPPY